MVSLSYRSFLIKDFAKKCKNKDREIYETCCLLTEGNKYKLYGLGVTRHPGPDDSCPALDAQAKIDAVSKDSESAAQRHAAWSQPVKNMAVKRAIQRMYLTLKARCWASWCRYARTAAQAKLEEAARNRIVAGNLRRRSIRTYSRSLGSNSKSSQDPR